jgi:hypothetical protein
MTIKGIKGHLMLYCDIWLQWAMTLRNLKMKLER